MLPTRMSIDRPQCRIEKRARERNADGSRGRLTTTTTTTTTSLPRPAPFKPNQQAAPRSACSASARRRTRAAPRTPAATSACAGR